MQPCALMCYCTKPRVFSLNRRYHTLDPTYVRVSMANNTLVQFVPTSIAHAGCTCRNMHKRFHVHCI